MALMSSIFVGLHTGGKTTSVDTRKRETQTNKLNLVVFGFDTFPRKKNTELSVSRIVIIDIPRRR